jgi:hypothetical protein
MGTATPIKLYRFPKAGKTNDYRLETSGPKKPPAGSWWLRGMTNNDAYSITTRAERKLGCRLGRRRSSHEAERMQRRASWASAPMLVQEEWSIRARWLTHAPRTSRTSITTLAAPGTSCDTRLPVRPGVDAHGPRYNLPSLDRTSRAMIS